MAADVMLRRWTWLVTQKSVGVVINAPPRPAEAGQGMSVMGYLDRRPSGSWATPLKGLPPSLPAMKRPFASLRLVYSPVCVFLN